MALGVLIWRLDRPWPTAWRTCGDWSRCRLVPARWKARRPAQIRSGEAGRHREGGHPYRLSRQAASGDLGRGCGSGPTDRADPRRPRWPTPLRWKQLSPDPAVAEEAALAAEGMGPLKLALGGGEGTDKGRAVSSTTPQAVAREGRAPLATARAGCGRGERGGYERRGGTLAGVARIRHRSQASSQRCRELHASSRVVQQSPTRCVDCPCYGTVKVDNASRTLDPGPKRASEGRKV
jgi:hypothetical protein